MVFRFQHFPLISTLPVKFPRFKWCVHIKNDSKLIFVSNLIIVFPSFISKLCLSYGELKCNFLIFRMVLYFCPACGGLLSVQMGREVQRLECRTCPYIHNILERGFFSLQVSTNLQTKEFCLEFLPKQNLSWTIKFLSIMTRKNLKNFRENPW